MTAWLLLTVLYKGMGATALGCMRGLHYSQESHYCISPSAWQLGVPSLLLCNTRPHGVHSAEACKSPGWNLPLKYVRLNSSKMSCPKPAGSFKCMRENTELSLEPATSFCNIKGSEKVLPGEEIWGGFCLLENKPSLISQIVELLTSGRDDPGVTIVFHLQKKILSCLQSEITSIRELLTRAYRSVETWWPALQLSRCTYWASWEEPTCSQLGFPDFPRNCHSWAGTSWSAPVLWK